MRRHRPTIGPGTVVAITGAASGIGRALALQLGREGVRLALADVDEPGLDDVVTTLLHEGREATGDVVDVADAAAVGRWAADVRFRWGRVDGVWSVAGIISAGDVLRAELADVRAVMDVDFWGSCTRPARSCRTSSPRGTGTSSPSRARSG